MKVVFKILEVVLTAALHVQEECQLAFVAAHLKRTLFGLCRCRVALVVRNEFSQHRSEHAAGRSCANANLVSNSTPLQTLSVQVSSSADISGVGSVSLFRGANLEPSELKDQKRTLCRLWLFRSALAAAW